MNNYRMNDYQNFKKRAEESFENGTAIGAYNKKYMSVFGLVAILFSAATLTYNTVKGSVAMVKNLSDGGNDGVKAPRFTINDNNNNQHREQRFGGHNGGHRRDRDYVNPRPRPYGNRVSPVFDKSVDNNSNY